MRRADLLRGKNNGCSAQWLTCVKFTGDVLHLTHPTLFPDLLAINASNNNNLFKPDNSLHLFEAIGILIGHSASKQSHYLSIFTAPQIARINDLLPQVQNDQNDNNANVTINQQLSMIIGMFAHLSKGFPMKQGGVSEDVCKIFKTTLETSIQTLSVLPNNDMIRTKLTFFVHRLILLLNEGILPFIPSILNLLITSATER